MATGATSAPARRRTTSVGLDLPLPRLEAEVNLEDSTPEDEAPTTDPHMSIMWRMEPPQIGILMQKTKLLWGGAEPLGL